MLPGQMEPVARCSVDRLVSVNSREFLKRLGEVSVLSGARSVSQQEAVGSQTPPILCDHLPTKSAISSWPGRGGRLRETAPGAHADLGKKTSAPTPPPLPTANKNSLFLFGACVCPRKFWLDSWAGQREGKSFFSFLVRREYSTEEKADRSL